jgi:hypothetical protein
MFELIKPERKEGYKTLKINTLQAYLSITTPLGLEAPAHSRFGGKPPGNLPNVSIWLDIANWRTSI